MKVLRRIEVALHLLRGRPLIYGCTFTGNSEGSLEPIDDLLISGCTFDTKARARAMLGRFPKALIWIEST